MDTESADELTPASGSRPEDDRSVAGAAAEVSADSVDAGPVSEDASPPGDDEQNLVVAQEVAPSGAGADKGDGPPADRPKKPILAAVAIGGAVLLAIPVLLIGRGSHDDKGHRSAAAAGNVLPGAGQQPPVGAFVSTSPSVTPDSVAYREPEGQEG